MVQVSPSPLLASVALTGSTASVGDGQGTGQGATRGFADLLATAGGAPAALPAPTSLPDDRPVGRSLAADGGNILPVPPLAIAATARPILPGKPGDGLPTLIGHVPEPVVDDQPRPAAQLPTITQPQAQSIERRPPNNAPARVIVQRDDAFADGEAEPTRATDEDVGEDHAPIAAFPPAPQPQVAPNIAPVADPVAAIERQHGQPISADPVDAAPVARRRGQSLAPASIAGANAEPALATVDEPRPVRPIAASERLIAAAPAALVGASVRIPQHVSGGTGQRPVHPATAPGPVTTLPKVASEAAAITPVPVAVASVPATQIRIALGGGDPPLQPLPGPVPASVATVITTASPAPLSPRDTVSGPQPDTVAAASVSAPAAIGAANPAPALIGVAQPAIRAFATAIAAIVRPALRREAPETDATASTLPTPVSVAVQRTAQPELPTAAVDTRRSDWPTRIVDHIEALRDAADARDTRITLIPHALGKIDVAVRQEGDTLHVHFAAEAPATRALITEAQPKLAEIAEQRGLRLGQSSVDSGTGQQAPQRQTAQAPQPPAPVRVRDPASFTGSEPAETIYRIA